MDAKSTLEVGFAGLGAMGYGMASNLLKAGISVTGFDPSPVALERFTKVGGRAVTSIAEAAKDQSLFLVMVATPGQVDSILFPPQTEGLCSSLPPNATLVLFSTLPPLFVSTLPSRLAKEGRGDIRVMDCPVSGGVVGAIGGNLSIMIGGDESTYAQIRPVLDAVSAPGRLFYCGDLGAASTMKMLNQHLAGSHIVATAEILTFAAALGLSASEARSIGMESVATSWMLGDRGALMLKADWTPRSAVTIFTKDLGIVCSSADEEYFPCPIASSSLEAFIERAAQGFGGDDDASVVCNYEGLVGKTVKETAATEDSPPVTPPAENSYGTGTEATEVAIIGEASEALRTTFSAAGQPGRTGGKGLAILSVPSDGQWQASQQQLSALSENSIVAVTGIRDPKAITSVLEELSTQYPTLQFVDGHVLPAPGQNGFQFLFSADDAKVSASVQELVRPFATPVPVSGKAGSATSMYLVIRLGALIHVTAAAECYGLAVAKKVSPEIVYDVIGGAAGSSAMLKMYFQDMMKRDFSGKGLGEFESVKGVLADLQILKGVTQNIKFPARLLDVVHQIFKGVYRKTGNGDHSVAAVVSHWD